MKGTYAPRFELAGADGVYKPAACDIKAKAKTITLAVPDGMKPECVAYMRRSCVHGFVKNEAGIPLGPFRATVDAK